MVIKRSSAAEVARLIEMLLSGDAVAREAAAARLAILGPRVVDRVAATLDGLQQPSHVVAVLDVLERIGDPRGAAAAAPRLADAREPVATAAVAAVRRALQAEGPQVAAHAMDALISVAGDETRPATLRAAAREALGDLPDEVVASLRQRWPGASGPPEAGRPAAAGPPGLDAAAFEAWAEGARAATSATQVKLAVTRLGGELPLPVLHRAVGRLRQLESSAEPGDRADWQAARGLAHQALAARGSRVALYDLRETVERDPAGLTVTMLAALKALGDASCLEPLAAAWARTDDEWMKGQLRAAFVEIAAREGLTSRHAALKRVGAHHPALLEALSTPSRTRPSRRRASRT